MLIDQGLKPFESETTTSETETIIRPSRKVKLDESHSDADSKSSDAKSAPLKNARKYQTLGSAQSKVNNLISPILKRQES